MVSPRIELSPPHLGENELALLTEAFRANQCATSGPHVDAFERETAAYVSAEHAVAVNSGSSALHVALLACGIGPGDIVWASTLASVAGAFAIRQIGATPVFVDCARDTWGMDAALVTDALEQAAARDTLPRALLVTHLYGQCADMDPIVDACARHDVLLVEDAAHAFGARYKGRSAGMLGDVGVYSFGSNKIITSSTGGMLVTPHAEIATRARQLRGGADPSDPHADHARVGYNFAMSNMLAAIGRGQLCKIEDRVHARRAVFQRYEHGLRDIPGVSFTSECTFESASSRSTRWLSVLTIDRGVFGVDAMAVHNALAAQHIESRTVRKPMHQQPVFRRADAIGGSAAEEISATGLCLPSGSAITVDEQARVMAVIRDLHQPMASTLVVSREHALTRALHAA